MMNLLLKQNGYPPAVLLALLLHAGLLWIIVDKTMSPSTMVKIEPAYISASAAKENPQKLRKLEQVQLKQATQQKALNDAKIKETKAKEQAVRDREAAQKAEAEARKKAETKRLADQRKLDDARKLEQEQLAAARRKSEIDALAEKQRQAELQRQAQQKIEDDRKATANAQAQSGNDDLRSQYARIIHDLITQSWVLPPGARNGMEAIVELRTTPVGDITSSIILKSSGDAAFDRSVLQAVARVGNFQELQDLPIAVYEESFRRFNLQFKPEDLLR